MIIFNLIKKLLGSLSDEDKALIKGFIEESLKAAARGAIEGAIKK